MIDREKIIRAVETCFDSWIDKHRNMGLDLHEVERMKRDALKLLKAQKAVEPHWRCSTVYMNGTGKIEMMCGNCGISIPLGKPNYCPWCGRAVKWDE